MGGGGGSSQPVKQEITQSSLPEYARPYFEGLMQRAGTELTKDYTPYGQDRIAGFTGQQQQLQQDILRQQTPGQFGTATGLASDVANRSIAAGQYDPGQFGAQQIGMPNLQQYSMGAARDVQGGQYSTPQMRAAQTGFQPNLNYFQMQGPQQFGTAQAQQYMSPFQQNVVDVQKREAIRDAQKGQIVQDLGAARQGTYGGSRQLLAGLERERNLGTQLGDIQARGSQAAFENAQAQFERDRAAGLTTGQANLQAQLGVQQLGTQTGMQTALANLDAASQSNVQNLAAKLQTQGLNADQAMRAALANQQADLTRGQADLSAALDTQRLGTQTGLEALRANQQADLERQRMAEQSRQFGSQQGLAGLAQAGQMGQTLANIGSAQSQADQARFGLQTSTAAQQQALQQQYLDKAYQDFLRQRDYPMEQLQQYSSLLRGVPVTPNSTTSTYGQQPGIGQQLLGTGLGAASIYKTFAGA
jgi:hypothetical protein